MDHHVSKLSKLEQTFEAGVEVPPELCPEALLTWIEVKGKFGSLKRGRGRVLLTEILLPRIIFIISMRG